MPINQNRNSVELANIILLHGESRECKQVSVRPEQDNGCRVCWGHMHTLNIWRVYPHTVQQTSHAITLHGQALKVLILAKRKLCEKGRERHIGGMVLAESAQHS